MRFLNWHLHHSLLMMVVSPGGAVMVTGMWMALLFRPAWLALVEFFWLSASSCFSPRLRVLLTGCRGLLLRPPSSASTCLSLAKQIWMLSQASESALRVLQASSAKWDKQTKTNQTFAVQTLRCWNMKVFSITAECFTALCSNHVSRALITANAFHSLCCSLTQNPFQAGLVVWMRTLGHLMFLESWFTVLKQVMASLSLRWGYMLLFRRNHIENPQITHNTLKSKDEVETLWSNSSSLHQFDHEDLLHTVSSKVMMLKHVCYLTLGSGEVGSNLRCS